MAEYMDDEAFSIGDFIDVRLDDIGLIHGEIVYITDNDDFIVKSKRKTVLYDITIESLRKRFPDFRHTDSTRGYCFCVVTDGDRDMDDFKNDYPELKRETSATEIEYLPLSGNSLERLREDIHTFIFQKGYSRSYITTFEKIRNGGPGLKSFYRVIKNYGYGYTADGFMKVLKRAIMTKQLDSIMQEENKKIQDFLRKNKRY